MPAQTTPITERQIDLITRAHNETGGLIEPLLEIKGGAKLKMIASLSQRGLIEQVEGQWRITPAAVAIIEGDTQPEDVLPAIEASVAAPPPAHDPELEADVAAAEARWQQTQPDVAAKRGRSNSKLSRVIAMLRRPEGATLAQICEATGWQAHTVRGVLAGAIKKRLGLCVVSERIEWPADSQGASQRVYRIAI